MGVVVKNAGKGCKAKNGKCRCCVRAAFVGHCMNNLPKVDGGNNFCLIFNASELADNKYHMIGGNNAREIGFQNAWENGVQIAKGIGLGILAMGYWQGKVCHRILASEYIP